MSEAKSEFRNTLDYVIGVIFYDEENKPRGGVVQPGDTVWLSEREQIATANGPKNPANNPLTNGALVEVTKATEVRHRRPLRPSAEQAVEGTEAVHEEVATPSAKPTKAPPREKTAAEIAAQRAVPGTQEAKPAAKPAESKAKAAPEGKQAKGEEVGTPDAKPEPAKVA